MYDLFSFIHAERAVMGHHERLGRQRDVIGSPVTPSHPVRRWTGLWLIRLGGALAGASQIPARAAIATPRGTNPKVWTAV